LGIDEVPQNSVEHLNSLLDLRLRVEDKYPSWGAKSWRFARRVDSKMREVFGNSEFVAIHAGLECGIFSKRFLDIEISSIGPTILSPHSIYEKVDMNSVEKTFNLILKLI